MCQRDAIRTYLVIVWAVGALLDRGVLLLVSDLNTDDRVHVEAGQLPRLDHRDAHLEVLGFQARAHGVHRGLGSVKRKATKKKI